MVVKNNIMALTNARYLNIVGGAEGKSTEKLSSGYRINRSADDAAGLSISEKMRRQIRGLTQASANAQDGISLVQSAEGALHEVHEMLQRMNELSIQAANGTYTENERKDIQAEIDQLRSEIDRIAETTKFNDVRVFDGTYEGQARVDSSKVRVFTEVVYDVDTVQSATGSATMAGYGALKDDLANEIVPQAVEAIVNTFNNTFGYLDGSKIGIGLKLYNGGTSSALAYVRMGAAGTSAGTVLSYTLGVNLSPLSFDASGNLTPQSREELEVTIAHEMMHALMGEALTSGMIGYTEDWQETDMFPKWFTEGMAQAVSGGYYNGNDWVNGGLGINASTSEATIKSILGKNGNRLGNSSNAANYGTGYLASMYLGYLASGGNSVAPADIAAGLDKILAEIKDGKTLSRAIADNTPYSSVADFEKKFASEGAAFVKELTAAVGAGSGALVTGNYADNNLLDDTPLNNPLFQLNTKNDRITNQYPGGYTVISGGSGGTGRGRWASGFGGDGLYLQIGNEQDESIRIHIESISSERLGLSYMDVTTQLSAREAIEMVKSALEIVSTQRAALGAYQNRLEHTVDNLDNIVENTQAAESRIRDTDMAAEMVQLSNMQVIRQAGQAMLAQTKQSTSGVLSLLQA